MGSLHCPLSGTTPASQYGGGKWGFRLTCGARLCSVMPCDSRKDTLSLAQGGMSSSQDVTRLLSTDPNHGAQVELLEEGEVELGRLRRAVEACCCQLSGPQMETHRPRRGRSSSAAQSSPSSKVPRAVEGRVTELLLSRGANVRHLSYAVAG